MTPNEYFTKIFCINRDARTDRWAHVEDQRRRFGLEIERVAAYDDIMVHGVVNGNAGCTASHRGLLEVIAWHRWPRVLVLEDDFEIRFPDFLERFAAMIGEVPEDWDMLYLGGGYGEAPQYRHSPHVIRINRMLTTSSYGVTAGMARRMAPYIAGVGPIDSLYGGFHHDSNCYIFQPRLMLQYANISDLQNRLMDNAPSMTDPHHEDMLLEGEWIVPSPPDKCRLRSKLVRSELAAKVDMNGLTVIVGRDRFTVLAIDDLPDHPSPWRRDEPCTYILKPQT